MFPFLSTFIISLFLHLLVLNVAGSRGVKMIQLMVLLAVAEAAETRAILGEVVIDANVSG